MLKICKQVFNGLALLSILFVLSCAHTNHYAEPSLPDSETAVLQANVPAWIISIDGQPVSYDFSSDGKTTKITAGPHTVQVSYKGTETKMKSEHGEMITHMKTQRFASIGYVPLNFVAKPGHTYFINARHDDKKWYPSIADFTAVNPPASGN